MADNLWAAFIADNGSNSILAASSADGVHWTQSLPLYQTSPHSPALAWFDSRLYAAFITDDVDSVTNIPSNRIFLCSTSDGVCWSSASFFNQYSKFAPSLAVWNGSLHIAFVANNATNTLLVYHSSNPGDAASWSATAATSQTSSAAPAIAAYGPPGRIGELYMAYVANNGSQDIFFSALTAGQSWSPGKATGHSCHFSPSLAAGAGLYLVFAGADDSRELRLSTLQTDGTWPPSASMNQATSATPGAAVFGGGLSAGFTASSSAEILLAANPAPASTWPTSNVDLKQQSAAGPAIAVATIACNPVLPGPTAANVNYLITNYDENNPLENITVTIVAEQDLVNTATYNAVHYQPVGQPVNPGFSIQLNCQPVGTIGGGAPPAGDAVWEQFGLTVQGASVFVWFDNSPASGVPPETPSPTPVFLLPKANTIPTGYKIEIKLVTDHSNSNVTAVSVNAWDDRGQAIKGGLGSSPVDGPWLWPVTKYLAPILNLELNVGGPGNGQYAKFQVDTPEFPILNVSYQADSPLMVRNLRPETAENCNLSFGLLAQYPANPIVQACNGS